MKAIKKIIIFGAGKIGRSFIGQLFSTAGYELVFIDVNDHIVRLINERRKYRVVIKSDIGDKVIVLKNARAIELKNVEMVARELADSPLAAVSVGQQGLRGLIPVFAKALLLRREKFGDWPLDVILAENMRNADGYFIRHLMPLLPEDFPDALLPGLVETSIGKMVPIMTQKDIDQDPLQVFAEPYNDLIVSGPGFKNPIPPINNLSPKENIKAWVDRKLFIHNLGHACAAYTGYLADNRLVYIYEALDIYEVFEATRQTMLQSSEILLAMYPEEFTPDQLNNHVDDLLLRFRNRALGDTLFRVGCDLYRKLGPEDRFTSPIREAIRLNKPYDRILKAMMAGLSFMAADENGKISEQDKKFFIESEKGIDYILKCISGFTDQEVQHITKLR
jgi:mannitol-1-phosphate 5-dehydrogenase